MTVAVLSLWDTATLATPGTASRLPLTMEGHAAQSMLFTAKVIVLSAAIAAGEAMMPTAKATWARSFFVARMRLVLTMRFGRARAHASPSAQARVEDR